MTAMFMIATNARILCEPMTTLLRRWRPTPVVAVGIIVCSGLGVGAATGGITFALRSVAPLLPYPVAERLVQFRQSGVFPDEVDLGRFLHYVSRRALEDLQTHTDVFEAVLPYRDNAALSLGDGRYSTLGVAAPHDFLTRLGMRLEIGRSFTPEEDEAGKGLVMVLSHRFWRNEFGRDPTVVGRKVETRFNGTFTVIGVLDSAAIFPVRRGTRYFIPLGNGIGEQLRNTDFPQALALLRPGVTRDRAQSLATTIAGRHAEGDRASARLLMDPEVDYIPPPRPVRIEVSPYRGPPLFGPERALVYAMLALSVALLSVAALNVASLTLVRSRVRQTESAVRVALGAKPLSLAAANIGEVAALVLIGGALGALACTGALAIVRGRLDPDLAFVIPGPDMRALPLAAAVALLSGIVAAAVPAVRLLRQDLHQVLQTGRELWSSPTSRGGLRRIVALEVTFTTVLLVGAALVSATVAHSARLDRGFEPEGVVAVRVTVSDSVPRVDGVRRALRLLETLPGVQQVTAGGAPVSPMFAVSARDITSASGDELPGFHWVNRVWGGYFRTMGISLLAGRAITDAEAGDGSHVAVVSHSVAEALWPSGTALGQAVRWLTDSGEVSLEVIGVAADMILALNEDGPLPWGQVHVPYGLTPDRQTYLLARVAGDPTSVLRDLSPSITRGDGGVTVADAMSLATALRRSVRLQVALATLFSLLAGVGLVLAVGGMFGVLAYTMHCRAREFGVRLALGASPTRLMIGTLHDAVRLLLGGIAVGLLVGVLMGKAMRALLFGLNPADPRLLAVVAGIVLIAGIGASLQPALGAARADPATPLRAE